MTDAWIQLSFPACEKAWEANPSALPATNEDFSCPDCGERRPVAEFTHTQRDFEIVESFHQA